MAQCPASEVRYGGPIGQGRGGWDGRAIGLGSAGDVELPGLPDGEALVLDLVGEGCWVGRLSKGLDRQDAGGLVVSMLARTGHRIHGQEDVRASHSNDADQRFQSCGAVPGFESHLSTFCIRPIALVEEVDILDPERAEAVAEFGFSEQAESWAPVASDHIAASLAAGGINVCDTLIEDMGVVGQCGRHPRLIVGMGEYSQDVGLQQSFSTGVVGWDLGFNGFGTHCQDSQDEQGGQPGIFRWDCHS